MSQTPPGTAQAAETPEHPIRTGVTLGRYQVQEFLFQGSHGPTYRAYEPHVQRSVAVEVLETLREPHARARLAQAAPMLTQLRHPNLVDVYEVGEREGVPYLVTAYVEGVSLDDAMRSGINIDGDLRVLQAAGRCVDYIHAQGVLHGDVRPATVVLAAEGRPLLREAGLMPLLEPGFRGSAFGIRTGALHYQAPEQLERGEVTAATDRYSFAVLAYELLTGAMPFAGQTTSEILTAKERMEPIPASTRNPLLGTTTDAVVAAGLVRDPAARWQSCAQMAEALQQAVADDAYRRRTYAAEEPAPVPYGPPSSARRRWPWVLAGAAIVGLAAVAILLWLNGQQPSAPGVSLSAAAVQAGSSVTVTASHLPANQAGTIQLQSTPVQVGTFKADQYGSAISTAQIPKDAQPGDHLISLCWNATCPASQPLVVLEPSPSSTPTPTRTPASTPTPTPISTSTPTPPRTPTPAPSSSSSPASSPR
ncbi:MAG TPA: protein kinase [Candidatus Dormibacteraeota bacterium]